MQLDQIPERVRVSPAQLARVLRQLERELELVPEVDPDVRIALERAAMFVNAFELGASEAVARAAVEHAQALVAIARREVRPCG